VSAIAFLRLVCWAGAMNTAIIDRAGRAQTNAGVFHLGKRDKI
jgi:hypothetical protein